MAEELLNEKYPAFEKLHCDIRRNAETGELHFDCEDKDASQELATGLEKEVVIHIKPAGVAPAAPVTE